jgi:hypothetical protein
MKRNRIYAKVRMTIPASVKIRILVRTTIRASGKICTQARISFPGFFLKSGPIILIALGKYPEKSVSSRMINV